MAYSFLSLLPIAVWRYPSFLPTGKVKWFKVSSEGSQKTILGPREAQSVEEFPTGACCSPASMRQPDSTRRSL